MERHPMVQRLACASSDLSRRQLVLTIEEIAGEMKAHLRIRRRNIDSCQNCWCAKLRQA